MNLLLRRLIVVCLCCWQPLPAALATMNCHWSAGTQLQRTAPEPSIHLAKPKAESGKKETFSEKAGCRNHEPAHQAKKQPSEDTQTSCGHCKNTCHTQAALFIASPLNSCAPDLDAPRFALPAFQGIVLALPQRPPQAS